MSDKESKYLYGLYRAPGVGRATAGKLLLSFGSAEGIFGDPESASRFIPDAKRREAFINFCRSDDLDAAYASLTKKGLHFAAITSDGYPKKLKNIPDPPFGITWRGRLPNPNKPSVAIIGARQCSPYGREMAAYFGQRLSMAGVQIISGMAVGIDGLAQRAALRAGGESFAVLGSGADVCYPRENSDLYNELISKCGVISENPPGTAPAGHLFPPRNRLISGLCDILLVIEARLRSGTSITVDMALDQGRDIFALPGRVNDGLSRGCNLLIRQGAFIATCPEDLLDALGNAVACDDKKRGTPAASLSECGDSPDAQLTLDLREKCDEAETLVAEALDLTPRTPAEIQEILALSSHPMDLPEVMEVLVGLCVKRIATMEAGRFMITGAAPSP